MRGDGQPRTCEERDARHARRRDPIILEVKGLTKSFWLQEGLFGKRAVPAVKDVSFTLRKGHTLGVVGESGSGKTTIGLTLLRLHDADRRRGALRRPRPARALRDAR